MIIFLFSVNREVGCLCVCESGSKAVMLHGQSHVTAHLSPPLLSHISVFPLGSYDGITQFQAIHGHIISRNNNSYLSSQTLLFARLVATAVHQT